MHKDYIDLIYRNLKGTSTDLEKSRLDFLVKQDPEVARVFEQYKQIWNSRVDHHVPADDAEKSEERRRLMSRIADLPVGSTEFRKQKPLLKYKFATAIFVVLGLCGYVANLMWVTMHTVEISTTDQRIMLPDSSWVTLNRNSIIKFRTTTSERRLYLTGEAYLDIRKDKNQPLYIYIEKSVIRVVGTSLVVKSYPGMPAEVIVVSGQVEVISGNTKLSIAASEKVHRAENTSLWEKSINTNPNFDAWYTHSLEFDQTPLRQVVEDLENYYHVEFAPVPIAVAGCRLQGTFDDEDINVVLQVVSVALNVEFIHEGDHYIVVGNGCR